MACETITDARHRDLAEAGPCRSSTGDAPDGGLDYRDLLLQEADHRIKNSLSIVASMLNVQRSSLSDAGAAAALGEAAARIMAVADIHRILQLDQQTGLVPIAPTLRELCKQLALIRPGMDIDCVADDTIVIDSAMALPLNLAVNELLLNAVKHAYPPGVAGPIIVGARRAGDVLEITVSDHGMGMPVTLPPARRLGQKLVRSF